jgi:Pycsar effector protein
VVLRGTEEGLNPNDRDALLERIVDRFAEWVRFGDAKAGGVLVLLGLGLVDLIDHATRLTAAHDLRSRWGDVATGLFWLALSFSALSVITVSRALFPRVKASADSDLFFGSVAQYPTGSKYAESIASLSTQQIERQLAEQAWELARIADRKYRRTREAFYLVLAFLVAWALARTALALAN